MTINAVSILREATQLYRRNLATVLGISATLQVAYVLVSIIAFNAFGLMGFYVAMLAALVVSQVTVGVLTLLVLQLRTSGASPGASALLGEVLPRTLSMLWLALLVSMRTWFAMFVIVLAGGIFLTAIAGAAGFGLATIVAICVAVYLYVTAVLAAPALVARRMGAVDAIKHSTELVKPQFWSVFVVVLLQGAIMIVGSLVGRHGAADQGAFEDVFLAQAFVTTFVAPLTGLALAETFLELTGFSPDGTKPDAPTAPQGVWTPHVPTAAAPTQPAYAAPEPYGGATGAPAY
ncbi:MAG: hypothetical protein REI11_22395, partial [Patulibacter sp.]|nr:hypothetical protein [Patulibacter sp.]